MQYVYTHEAGLRAVVVQYNMEGAIEHLLYEMLDNFAAGWNAYCPEEQQIRDALDLFLKPSLVPDNSVMDQLGDEQVQELNFIGLIWLAYRMECSQRDDCDEITPALLRKVYKSFRDFRIDLADSMSKL